MLSIYFLRNKDNKSTSVISTCTSLYYILTFRYPFHVFVRCLIKKNVLTSYQMQKFHSTMSKDALFVMCMILCIILTTCSILLNYFQFQLTIDNCCHSKPSYIHEVFRVRVDMIKILNVGRCLTRIRKLIIAVLKNSNVQYMHSFYSFIFLKK